MTRLCLFTTGQGGLVHHPDHIEVAPPFRHHAASTVALVILVGGSIRAPLASQHPTLGAPFRDRSGAGRCSARVMRQKARETYKTCRRAGGQDHVILGHGPR